MKGIGNLIDSVSEFTAQAVKWLTAVLIATICYEVFQRYILDRSLVWIYETSFMLGALIISLGQGYIMKTRGHARVDVLFERFSRKTQYAVDIFSDIFLFLPTYILLTYAFWRDFLYSYVSKERSIVSTWYPLLWPLKLCILLGLLLMVLQFIVMICRDVSSYAGMKKGGTGDAD